MNSAGNHIVLGFPGGDDDYYYFGIVKIYEFDEITTMWKQAGGDIVGAVGASGYILSMKS